MVHRFAEIDFTPTVKKVQEQQGSRKAYARMEDTEGSANQHLGETEAGFISARNSFYMATVSETGWPYLQHRGGPTGFVRVLDETTIGFADFRGNRQYVSVGNLMTDNRVSLFFMDYANKKRLKLEGFDWNCPQHIAQCFSLDEVYAITAQLTSRIAELEAERARRLNPQAGP
jgi:predicted pyridoxine 5'-phosphate oxidase superfamily flavin-nucleotide-binding protein